MNLGRTWASRVFTATFNVLKNINPFAHGGIVGGGMATGGAARGIPGYASGGTLAMVGEAGPELVNLPFGSRVNSNPDTGRLLGGGGRGGGEPTRIILEFAGADAEFLKFVRKTVRGVAGNGSDSVQVAFGPG